MSYGLIYTIPFASLKNEACIIEIEKEGYTGKATELTGAESPFTVEIVDDDFMYIPTRFSTAKIAIVGSDYLQNLYSTAYQQYRVTFKRNDSITWCGFIKPELYTQDYSSKLFELEIECQSAMSTLEFISYKQTGKEGKVFVSLWNLLKKAIILSNAKYNSVLFPHVYSETAALYPSDIDNVLEKMRISEQNFFDEDDKAMTYREVLEEICKFLNWTCVDWRGDLYFVDVDHRGDYWQYSLDMMSWEPGKLPDLLNVQKTGFAGSDHSLDLVPGYNKVTVKTSNYNIPNELFADIDFDKSDLIASSVKANAHINPTQMFMKNYLLNNSVDAILYKEENGGMIEVDADEYKGNPDSLNSLYGARLVQTCTYDPRDSEISEYTYENSIQIRVKDLSNITVTDNKLVVARFLCKDVKVYPTGVLCISGNIMPFYKNSEMSMLSDEDTGVDRIMFIRLRIGDKKFNYFGLTHMAGKGFRNIKNHKFPDMPYKGLRGYIIPIKNTLIGDFELSIIMVKPDESGRPNISPCIGYYLKDFKVVYQKPDDVLKSEDGNSDRYYENIVNKDYINELDEIEFKISSYNNDGACYSKVMLGDKYLEDNLYSAIEGKQIRPEEQLIRRIINRYSDTHIKLTQEIQEVPDLTPISRLSDNYMVGKIFLNTGGTIDYKQGKFRCIMIEV